jgi:2,5-diamino-6-(ribosylamino)-4(3H)-pyrimidinone 5'-phosphate reductase
MIEGGATVINDLLREKNQHFISSVIVTIAPIYLGSGGVVVTPPRTYPHKTEVVLPKQSVRWLPFGKDIVMACGVGTLE